MNSHSTAIIIVHTAAVSDTFLSRGGYTMTLAPKFIVYVSDIREFLVGRYPGIE